MQPSIDSKILHWLGCVFIGKPSELGVPDDFYFVPGDRRLPDSISDPRTQRKRLAVDALRRPLFARVGYVSAAVAATVCILAFGGVHLSLGLGSAFRAVTGPGVAAINDRCAQARQMDLSKLTPEQRERFESQCGKGDLP